MGSIEANLVVHRLEHHWVNCVGMSADRWGLARSRSHRWSEKLLHRCQFPFVRPTRTVSREDLSGGYERHSPLHEIGEGAPVQMLGVVLTHGDQ